MLTITYPNASITIRQNEVDAIQSHLERAKSLALPVEITPTKIVITNIDGSKYTLENITGDK